MLWNNHEANHIGTGKTDRAGNIVCKCAIIAGYNTHMGVLDKVDQHLHNQEINHNFFDISICLWLAFKSHCFHGHT